MNKNKLTEIYKFDNLTDIELYTLKSIYQKRLNQINYEVKKRIQRNDIPQISIDIMVRHGHCDDIFKADANNMYNKFNKSINWDLIHSKNTSESLALCIVYNIYEKYNIEFNPHTYLNDFGIDGTQFQMLYSKLKDWCKNNYWLK